MTRYRANRKPPVRPVGGWAKASYGFTWGIEDMAERQDLVVKIAPDAGFDDSAYDAQGNLIVWTQEMIDELKASGAPIDDKEAKEMLGKPLGQQHPGVTFPNEGIIEINPKYLPDDVREHPESIKAELRSDRDRYPVAWGLAAHEAAHANHSLWMDDLQGREMSEEDQRAAGAAVILEESRIEAKHIDARPQDGQWLQASGMRIALDEVASGVKATKEYLAQHPELQGKVEIDKVRMSRAAALVLARIDAGSVEENEDTAEVEKMVRDVFGDEGYDRLRRLWLEAQDTEDDDTEGMMNIGRQWYEITGDGGQDSGDDGGEGGDGDQDGKGEGDALGNAMRRAARNARREASGEAGRDRLRKRIQGKADRLRQEMADRKNAKQKASSVFAGQAQPVGHPVHGYRPPTSAESNLARATRRKLQAAYVPERAVTKVQRSLPPGRLSVRSAQQLEAQVAAGLMPDVEPFTYKDRRHVVTPPLKVGIIQDVSGSQQGAAEAAVSGAWSLARAASAIEDAQVAMVTFGNSVHKIVGPRERMPKVPIIRANAGTQYFADAVRAIEGVLDLTRPGSARLLVILTDGYLDYRDLEVRDRILKRLTEYGVKVLWMVTDGEGDDQYVPHVKGVHVFRKASGQYDVIPRVIADQAVEALKK